MKSPANLTIKPTRLWIRVVGWCLIAQFSILFGSAIILSLIE